MQGECEIECPGWGPGGQHQWTLPSCVVGGGVALLAAGAQAVHYDQRSMDSGRSGRKHAIHGAGIMSMGISLTATACSHIWHVTRTKSWQENMSTASMLVRLCTRALSLVCTSCRRVQPKVAQPQAANQTLGTDSTQLGVWPASQLVLCMLALCLLACRVLPTCWLACHQGAMPSNMTGRNMVSCLDQVGISHWKQAPTPAALQAYHRTTCIRSLHMTPAHLPAKQATLADVGCRVSVCVDG